MFVIQPKLRTLLCGLVVIVIALSAIVRAQQPQSQLSTVDQKQKKLVDEQPPTNPITEPDSSGDAKLPIYQVHRIAEKILALNSVRAKAFEMARLAGLLWKQDEPYARALFEKAINLTTAQGTDAEARALSTLHRRVLAVLARSDPEWAKQLIDSAAKRETEDQGSKAFSAANLATARGLLEEDPTVAVQFAERSLKGGVSWGFLDFIQNLRKKDEPEANRLFLQSLNYLSQQPSVNILDFHTLGLYLFTAPNLIDPDHHAMTLVDQILVPNITIDRPGVPNGMVRAYLATAADVLWRMTSDAEQRKYSYALCYMLLPKSKNAAPDLTARLDAVMAALTPQVPTGMTKDSAFRYMNPPSITTEEKLTNAENKPDQESRDMAYLEIALQAWHKGDFKTSRIAQGRISELGPSQRLAAIIDFGDGAWTIKQKAADGAKAEAMANRLPLGIERSVLLQAISKTRGKVTDRFLAEEIVDKALKAARSTSDGRRPFLLLAAAAQLANLKSAAVHTAMAETIKDFNSFEETALGRLDWAQTVQIGPLNARFPLDVAGVDFSFTEAFHTVAVVDPEAAMARAEELRHENLRAQALVEVGRAFLEKIPSKPAKQKRKNSGGPQPASSTKSAGLRFSSSIYRFDKREIEIWTSSR